MLLVMAHTKFPSFKAHNGVFTSYSSGVYEPLKEERFRDYFLEFSDAHRCRYRSVMIQMGAIK